MIWYYFIFINMIGISVMGIDKYKARHHFYRIPEKVLFIVSIIGGSLGVWVGMYAFHHKTKHWYFVIGIPVIFFMQVILFVKLC